MLQTFENLSSNGIDIVSAIFGAGVNFVQGIFEAINGIFA